MKSHSKVSGVISSGSSYVENRKELKNGFIVSFLIFCKSTMSIGLMNNQSYYFDSGWLLGVINTLLISSVVCYSMILLVRIANDIEKKKKGIEIDTFEGISWYLTKNEKWNNYIYICKSSFLIS